MSSSTCYISPGVSFVSQDLFKPCGPPSSTGFVQCCSTGDGCGAHDFCNYTHGLVGGSGYYLAGCTDPAFQDPSCPRQCFGLKTYDVVFSSSTGLWACCNSPARGLNCSSPSNVTFEAPSPESLFATPFSILTASKSQSSISGSTSTQSTTVSTNSSGSSATSQTVTATVTVISQVDSSANLSNGAKAGIGVGVAVIVVMAGLGILLLWRKRSRRQQQRNNQPSFEQNLGVACDVKTNSSNH